MTRNDTIAFLRCVLPPEGYYCAVVYKTANPKPGVDKPWQTFFSTVEDLANFILQQDQLGRTTYHACASFRDPEGIWNERKQKVERRTQQNALLANAFWFDIDCDPSGFKKKQPCYVDQQSAARAVVVFCRAVGLPAPLFVDSGYGLHCYWPLDQPLAPEEWRGYAEGLKALAHQHGLKIDPARTADIASILRTPGTHNRKNEGERLVRYDVHGIQNGHAAGVFQTLLRKGCEFNAPRTTLVRRDPQPIAGRRRSISASIDSGNTYGTVYADRIADSCAQLALLRQTGDLPEPQWYALLGVLCRCEDGEVKAHEWSAKDYPGYVPADVSSRLERSRNLSGATTCERLHALDPATCERCLFWGRIKSPISIPTSSDNAGFGISRNNDGVPDRGGSSFRLHDETVATLPKGYHLIDGKIWFITEDRNGDSSEVLICTELLLKSVQTSELDATSHSYRFSHHLPKKGHTDVVIDAKVMFGAAGIAELAGKGVVVHDGKLFLNYVRLAVDDFNTENATHVRYDQFGWKSDNTAFLYGRHLYTPVGPVEAIGAKEVETRSQWIGPRPRGNVEAWTEAADALFASDMEAYSAMVLASFAAPLMRFQSADEGGAILHLFTPASGQGKTTALNAAWSVWGTKEGLALTNEDTRVSKPIAIGTLANLPVIYDELRDKDPEYIRRMVVMFTEGRDRMRGMVDGTIRHTKANWQTILLSAANNSLIDQLQGDGVDAPAFRVLEMSSTLSQKIDKTKGDRLKRILNDNAGHAGDAYLRYLLHPPALEFAKDSLEKWTQEIWDITRLDSAHRFRVRAVGAIAVASALVNKLGILHFQTDRILQWLIKELGSGKNVGTVSAAMPAESAINTLGEFINEHLGEMLVVRHEWRPRRDKQLPIVKPANRLSIRYEIEPQRVFISESVFREWMLRRQMSPRTVIETLEKQLIVTARKRAITLSAGTDIPGAQVVCVEINAAHPTMSGLVASVRELQQERSA